MSKASRRPTKASLSREERPANETGSLGSAAMPPEESARYIAELSAELSYLARQANLDLLAYLLDMARLEALRTAQASVRGR